MWYMILMTIGFVVVTTAVILLVIAISKMSTVLINQDERLSSFNEYCQVVSDDLHKVQDMIKNQELMDLESKRVLIAEVEKCINELNMEL